ncbi:MAG: DNA-directed RNA polymerase subunit L [Candidatus Diapherotrites archaeon]
MKINILKEEKNLLEFKIENEKHSIPSLLKAKLLEDNEVEFVAYTLDHPADTSCKFILKTKSKTPKKVLEEATKSLETELTEFSNKLKKSLK